MKTERKSSLFDAPGVYRIRVQGRFAVHQVDPFCGMTNCASRVRGRPPTTTLTGLVLDQACLISVLTELYDMGYPLLNVERVRGKPAHAAAAPQE